jgi:hypothetical protein
LDDKECAWRGRRLSICPSRTSNLFSPAEPKGTFSATARYTIRWKKCAAYTAFQKLRPHKSPKHSAAIYLLSLVETLLKRRAHVGSRHRIILPNPTGGYLNQSIFNNAGAGIPPLGSSSHRSTSANDGSNGGGGVSFRYSLRELGDFCHTTTAPVRAPRSEACSALTRRRRTPLAFVGQLPAPPPPRHALGARE